MSFPSSLAIIILLTAGTISAVLAYAGWRNRAIPISRPFTLLMAAETVWIFGYLLELTSPSLQAVLLINDIEYPALQTVPVAWLFIVLVYTGREHYLTRRTIPLFFIVPAIVWILVLTNPVHHLYYSGFSPLFVNGSVLWVYEHGPLFWIHIAYCYILALIALVLVAGRLFAATALYRRQTLLLFCAACIPAFCNMAYVFQLAPFPEYDLTPFAFLVTGIVIAVGLLRYQLFSAVPVAYSKVFQTMSDGVVVLNGQFRVMDLNPAAETIAGIRSCDAIGRPVGEVVPGLAPLQENSLPVQPGHHIEIQIRNGGSLRFYDVLVTPMGVSGAGSFGFICLLRDISGRKQAELALAQANKKIALLSSITRHDLQNKLMAVASYLELSRDLATDPEQKEYLSLQEEAMDAMREQIAFTAEYDKLGSKMPVWQEVSAAISRARDQVYLRNISLSDRSGSLEVYADPMLEKVFYNLFENAVKYGGENLSSIVISSRPSGDDIVIVVEDDGNGISEEDKVRLFERGFGKNTGLGLFLSREILAITDITIRETGRPGHGALFEILVPCGKFRFADGRQ
jgi:PAS domain S-box-containing protein